MKYKVGDKVRIRSKEWYDENRNGSADVITKSNRFVNSMAKYCGMTATITGTHVGFKKKDYSIDIDNGEWMWAEETFECLVSDTPKNQSSLPI